MKANLFVLLGSCMVLLATGCGTLPTSDFAAESGDERSMENDAALLVIDMDGEKRNVLIKFNESAAPQTVQNFKKNVNDGTYEGLAFHRVIPNYLVQTGDPLTKDEFQKDNWGTGGPGYTIPAEAGVPHARGSVAMARLNDTINPNQSSNGSQFYIALRKLSKLDGQYTVFGEVTYGLNVLQEMAKKRTDQNDVPVERIEVSSIRLVSSKARFVERKKTKKAPPATQSDAEKGGMTRFIEKIW